MDPVTPGWQPAGRALHRRTRMCSVLRMAVKDGVISAEEHTLLMDHLLSTADHSYRVETRDFPDYDPDESDFELGELDG